MHEFHILVLNFNLTKLAFHNCSPGSLPSRAHVRLMAEMETVSVWVFFLCRLVAAVFLTATKQVNQYIKGFPLQTGTLSPVVRLGSCCSGHTHQTHFSMGRLFGEVEELGLW